jgi:hypothetical protein
MPKVLTAFTFLGRLAIINHFAGLAKVFLAASFACSVEHGLRPLFSIVVIVRAE